MEGLCCLKCEEKIIDAIRKVHGKCFMVSAFNFYVSDNRSTSTQYSTSET